MDINKMAILYVIYKSRTNRSGKSALYCRLTYKKKRKEFATGYFINPSNWESKTQKLKSSTEEDKFINLQLSLIKNNINQAFLFLQVNKENINVEDIYNQYKGLTVNTEIGVVENYNLFLEYLKKLINVELNQDTYNKYVVYGKHLKSFIKKKYKLNDVKIESIKFNFIEHFEYYLKTETKFAQITINKVIQRFRRSIKFAISEDILFRDPFLMYKNKPIKKSILFLSKKQLHDLETKKFSIARIEYIRDLFVFCCYTGLAFKEMVNLKKEHLVKEFDGEIWLKIYRTKTKNYYKIPLLPKAKVIIDNYNVDNSVYVFKRISNTNFNAYLKEIADIVGINFNLTHHIARKTFATTVLLYNDVSMEVVSKLLGHSKMQTTQEHYGVIIEKKISEEISKLNIKMKN